MLEKPFVLKKPGRAQASTLGVAFWFVQRVPSKLCSNCSDAPPSGFGRGTTGVLACAAGAGSFLRVLARRQGARYTATGCAHARGPVRACWRGAGGSFNLAEVETLALAISRVPALPAASTSRLTPSTTHTCLKHTGIVRRPLALESGGLVILRWDGTEHAAGRAGESLTAPAIPRAQRSLAGLRVLRE